MRATKKPFLTEGPHSTCLGYPHYEYGLSCYDFPQWKFGNADLTKSSCMNPMSVDEFTAYVGIFVAYNRVR